MKRTALAVCVGLLKFGSKRTLMTDSLSLIQIANFFLGRIHKRMQLRQQPAVSSDKELASRLLKFARRSLPTVQSSIVSPYHRTIKKVPYCIVSRRRSNRIHTPVPRPVPRLSRAACLSAGGRWIRRAQYDVERRENTHLVDVLRNRCIVCSNVFDDTLRVPWGCFCEQFQDYVHYMCAVCYDANMRTAITNAPEEEPVFACPVCGDDWACNLPVKIVGRKTERQFYNELSTGLSRMLNGDPYDPILNRNILEVERLTNTLSETSWIEDLRLKIQACKNMLRFRPEAEGYNDALRNFHRNKSIKPGSETGP